jgi:diadenosine tetraphosphate (Ap4A) HIT family hydrolase
VCPSCTLPAGRPLFRNDAAVVVRDAYPITPGHTLAIPLRHVASFFDATPSDRDAMLALLDVAKQQLQTEFDRAGYNIGVNDGAAAGQTIGHLHIHLIPQYPGDRPEPSGGVRWVIPERADYWTDGGTEAGTKHDRAHRHQHPPTRRPSCSSVRFACSPKPSATPGSTRDRSGT